jgi:hypothetical protein
VAGDFEGSGDEAWVERDGWRWVGRHFGLSLRCCERLYVSG